MTFMGRLLLALAVFVFFGVFWILVIREPKAKRLAKDSPPVVSDELRTAASAMYARRQMTRRREGRRA